MQGNFACSSAAIESHFKKCVAKNEEKNPTNFFLDFNFPNECFIPKDDVLFRPENPNKQCNKRYLSRVAEFHAPEAHRIRKHRNHRNVPVSVSGARKKNVFILN